MFLWRKIRNACWLPVEAQSDRTAPGMGSFCFLLHVQDFERSMYPQIGESADLFRARLVKRTVGTGLLISPDEWNAVCKRRYRIKWLRLKLRISCSLAAIMARVGVWTRPQESCALYLQVRARVALMPTTQSDSARATAARYKL